MGGGREARVPFVGRRLPWRAGLARGLAVDLGRRSRRSVTCARKVREEGDGADRRARGLSESDARAGGERHWQVGLRVGALTRSWARRWTGLRRARCAERKGAPTSGV